MKLLLLPRPIIFMEGIGEYYQTWLYPDKGLDITLGAGESETGAKKVASFTASTGCELEC